MPVELERKLRKEARNKGLTGEAFDAYVYGGLRKAGWVPPKEKKGRSKKK